MMDSLDKKLSAVINQDKPLVDGDAIGQFAGKRIRDIYFKQSADGSIKQLVLISTDYEAFVMTVNGNEVKLVSSSALHEVVSKLLGEPNMNTIHSGLMDFSDTESVNRLFHTLWTKAVGADSYVKAEWQELGKVLIKAGCRRD